MPTIVWLFILSCSGTNFQDKLSMGGKQGSKDQVSQVTTDVTEIPGQVDTTINPPTENSGELNPVYPMPPGTAVIPVAIGGASLTCVRDESYGMMCSGDASEPSRTFVPTTALFATEIEKTWIATNFLKTKEGRYAVEIPESLKKTSIGVSVMLIDAENRYMADMSTQDGPELLNLIKDASFEDWTIDPKDLVQSRIIVPESQTNWKASRVLEADKEDCISLIEMEAESLRPTFHAASGMQWMELSSRCNLDPGAPRKNLGIRQDLALEAGETYYFSFAFRAPAGELTEHNLRVSLGGEAVLSLAVKDPRWKHASFLYVPEEGDIPLQFDEFSINPGRGTNIDMVHVVKVPQAEAPVRAWIPGPP